MLVLGFKKLGKSLPKITVDVNENRGSPTWRSPPNGDRDKIGLESSG
jgi:hypothetical protein